MLVFLSGLESLLHLVDLVSGRLSLPAFSVWPCLSVSGKSDSLCILFFSKGFVSNTLGFAQCRYSPNQILIYLCIAFILITLGFLLMDWLVFDPLIQYLTLFYGTFIGWYGIMDIWDDTISRTVEGSDAFACHKMWPCCLPRCVGVQFALCAIVFQALGMYFALVWLTDNNI